MDEFTGVTFRCYSGYLDAATDSGTVQLYTGMPIWSVYFYDLTNLELQIGDLVEISYNGEILESYPAQLGEVYKITVIEQTGADAMWDRIPMVRVNGKLYYDTGEKSTRQ